MRSKFGRNEGCFICRIVAQTPVLHMLTESNLSLAVYRIRYLVNIQSYSFVGKILSVHGSSEILRKGLGERQTSTEEFCDAEIEHRDWFQIGLFEVDLVPM